MLHDAATGTVVASNQGMLLAGDTRTAGMSVVFGSNDVVVKGLFRGQGPIFGVDAFDRSSRPVVSFLSIRSLDEPGVELARLVHDPPRLRVMGGDAGVLSALPPYHGMSWPWLARLGPEPALIDISPHIPEAEPDDPEDPMGLTASPDGETVAVSRWRGGGTCYLLDPESRVVTGTVYLPGQQRYAWRRDPEEVWLANATTLVRAARPGGAVLDRVALHHNPRRWFVGSIRWSAARTRLFLDLRHRPGALGNHVYQTRYLLLDPERFVVTDRAAMAGWPGASTLVGDDVMYVARDPPQLHTVPLGPAEVTLPLELPDAV